jgi:transcriptional regulator with XRE-family HTH domain
MAATPSTLRGNFARRLRAERLRLGISQRELGRRIGLSEDVVSNRVTRYESGASEPDFETVRKLAQALDVPVAYLLADSDLLGEIILAASSLSAAEQKRLLATLKTKKVARGD